ncbi:MAG: ATP-grasp domain-containing protein [Saprospiraceae bacterium]|nr:ATP-grasp domain-containing protein [Saprospiraceae bacterium]
MSIENLSSEICLLKSVLVANRGEIASRIFRTCRKMGIKSIAVFSEADRSAPFVGEADMAVFIGESQPSASYLDQDKIIQVAKQLGADAIHPGYGFLSENAGFAKRCAEEGMIFIGPNPKAIEAMGSKAEAKAIMEAHGVPVVPGYQGEDQSREKLLAAAKEVGFPLLLKATAGGGGKGMRIVQEPEDLEAAIEAAKREARNAFGDDRLIIEKYIESGRHLEFQIFGDQYGNAIHVLERECSIQRRYQKVIEESPSPVMSAELRQQMGAAAVNAARALQYDNAGTVEFIYDDQSGDFYFLEVNTRLQVEHPVTEEITGLDLVQMQFESAMGKALSLQQAAVMGRGYAIEARLYAEDASNNFLPVTGKIHRFAWPEVEGLRVETAVQSGSEISIFYDPMIAKLIVWDEDRAAAHRKLTYVLRSLQCLGVKTNQDFLLKLLQHPDFLVGKYNTHFIAEKMNLEALTGVEDQAQDVGAIAATLIQWKEREGRRTLLSGLPSGWRNSFYESQKVSYVVGEKEIQLRYRKQASNFEFEVETHSYQVQLVEMADGHIRLEVNGVQYRVYWVKEGAQFFLQQESLGSLVLEELDRFPTQESEAESGGYVAPMPSQVVKILVESGQQVIAGQDLIVLSSMKMENTLTATEDGVVAEIYAEEGGNVPAGFLLLQLNND